MLATRGIAPATTLSQSRMVVTAVQRLEQQTASTLAQGWWFNTETRELQPNADQRIYVPQDYLSVRVPRPGTAVARGRTMYDPVAGTDLFTKPVCVLVRRAIPFEDIPELVAAYIVADARHKYQRDYDGDSTKTRDLFAELVAARAAAMSEEIRQQQANLLLANPTVQYLHSRRSRR